MTPVGPWTTVAASERGVAALAEARDILAEFQGIIWRKALPRNLMIGSTAPHAVSLARGATSDGAETLSATSIS
jgi:hypothetical protein